MEFTLPSRFKKAWSVFIGRDPIKQTDYLGGGYSYRPDRMRFSPGNEQTIAASVCNRIALDVASLNIQHVQLDSNGRFEYARDSSLNNCLTLEANLDQTGRAFIQDAIASMMDEGCIALVPTVTDKDPDDGSYEICEIRVGRIVTWYPQHIRVEVYNDLIGQKREVVVPKSEVAIIENPFYAVQNEPNSTLKRLVRKLRLLDIMDEKAGNGKLDLIIQLPYVIKGETRRQQAELRRKNIEEQLANSQYGIAYTDATEHITQLNRATENNLLTQIEYLTKLYYSEMNITSSVMDGTADESTMLNYYSRTIEPMASALTDEMKRKFLTKTARTQGQSIEFFRDPFNLVPVNNIAEIADKFTRNEIMTSNEIRQIIGMKPSKDPNADVLRNKNLNQAQAKDGVVQPTVDVNGNTVDDGQTQGAVNQEVSDVAFGQLINGIEQGFDTLIQGYMDGKIDTDAETLANAIKSMAAQYSTEGMSPDQANVFESYLQGLNDDIDSTFGLKHSEIIDDILAHYASPYYDPVKAHEYYERTKVLKGRRSTSALNDEGKKIWSYTKEQISTAKKNEVTTEQEKMNATITKSRETATASREKIAAKLKSLNEALTARSTQQKADVNAKRDAAVKAATDKRDRELEKIKEDNERRRAEIQSKRDQEIERLKNDSSLSSEERKEAQAKVREDAKTELAGVTTDIANEKTKVREKATATSTKARNEAKAENEQITADTKTERTANQAAATSEREAVAANLKTEIANARQAFTDAKTALTEKYEGVLDSEYNKIAAEYPKQTKK